MKENIEETEYAVITGASSGLGRSFALELASRKISTILVSLPGEGISEVCAQCRRKGTESVFYEADLTDREELLKITEEINSRYKVKILINNAGTGGSTVFEKASLRYLDNIIQLNTGVTTFMTHELIPNLRQNAPSYILNISSLASMTPTGYKTVYPASKNFIKYFSIGLREEMKDSSVSVSVALLGPMPTRPEIVERIKSQGWIGKFLTVTTKIAARRCVEMMFRGKGIIVVGISNKFSYWILKFIPERLRASIMTRTMKNELRCQGITTIK